MKLEERKKRKKLKALILFSFLLMGLGSCGSDKEASVVSSDSDSSGSSTSSSSSSSECVASSNWSDFRSRIEHDDFINQAYDIERYYYKKVKCKESTWWIFNTSQCSAGQFIRYSNLNYSSLTHEKGSTREDIREFLLSIIDNATDRTGEGRTYYDVKDSDGNIYRISLCHPLVANPIGFKSSDGKNFYEYLGKRFY